MALLLKSIIFSFIDPKLSCLISVGQKCCQVSQGSSGGQHLYTIVDLCTILISDFGAVATVFKVGLILLFSIIVTLCCFILNNKAQLLFQGNDKGLVTSCSWPSHTTESLCYKKYEPEWCNSDMDSYVSAVVISVYKYPQNYILLILTSQSNWMRACLALQLYYYQQHCQMT